MPCAEMLSNCSIELTVVLALDKYPIVVDIDFISEALRVISQGHHLALAANNQTKIMSILSMPSTIQSIFREYSPQIAFNN